MGKLSKRLKKIGKVALAAGAAYGASKLMNKKGIAFGRPKEGTIDAMAKARKLPSNLTKDMGTGSYKNRDIIKVPFKKGVNQKSLRVADDGSITQGTTKYKNKKVYSDAMKKKRGEKTDGGGFKNFLNKAILGKKTQLKKAGGMTKARHGKMMKANTGRMNLLEEMGRIDANKRPDRNVRAEKRRVISELNSGAKKGKMMKAYKGGMAEISTRGQGVILAGKKTKTYIC